MNLDLDALSRQFQQLGWVDLVLLAVLGVSVLVGLWRGFAFEMISLLGWLIAYVIANTLGPLLAAQLPFAENAPALRLWGAYLVVFLLVLVACGVLARMMRAVIAATPLSAVDRLLGGLFGFARGTLILVIAATLVTLSPFSRSPAWRDSHGAPWLGKALQGLKPLLPQSLDLHL